jgi:flagellar biosynthesis/type III secretory pathway protein FliH
MEQPGLFPLLPLTKGGIRQEVTEQMITGLKASEQTDLLAIGGTLASLVFSREHSPDLEWLHRRLREMHDVLRESPYYQEILQEGREEGIVKGLEEGLQKGLEEGLQKGLQEGVQKGKPEGQRETLLAIVQIRFPKIVRLAKKLVAANDNPASLQTLTVKISMAQTTEEAKQYLLEEDEENGD